MDKWVDAVKKCEKIINLSEIEIDEDLLNAIKTHELEHSSNYSWGMSEDVPQQFWEWMPVHIHWPDDGDEDDENEEDEKKEEDQLIIYYVNVWKSSPKFKTFVCVREVNVEDFFEVEERPDINQDWIIDQLNAEITINL